MKLRFILCHPAPDLHGELREGLLARELRALGHDAAVLRAEASAAPRSVVFDGGVPIHYFPSDAPEVQAHRQGSTAMVEWLRADAPDAVLFKGMDYDIVAQCLEALDRARCRIGFVIGGTSIHRNLAAADFVLAESEGQIEAIARRLGRVLPAVRLPKHIDWPGADAAYAATRAPEAKAYDLCNVGSFEPRKNQAALAPLFAGCRIALVGDGETRARVAALAEGHPLVRLTGHLPQPEAFRVMAQSWLMAHASTWEGVPRVILESLACGTPVIAHDFAIQARFDTPAVRLVPAEALVSAIRALLADRPALLALGEEARRYALERHGPGLLAPAAATLLALAQGREA
ncbi:glycosyltransferase family 4 protein [Belnapia sp. F-4-1]|uniref:glycosyltransferase family 4 protein n=1 Tax=Belnapia sp. F-4-1 TaxID=1545443 RepID=UPI0005BE6E70|nr:glycosyltransferase family 4 protein [Belnapia sp. F-4-1]